MPTNFSILAKKLASIEKDGGRNSVFAFVETSVATEPSHLTKSPLSALMSLRDRISGEISSDSKEFTSEHAYQQVISGRFVLGEFHLFVKFNDEHILAQRQSGRGMQVARRQARGKDAFRALSASSDYRPRVEYEGLPLDEDT